jgi:uncharacterized protein YcbK (DUF882 family)
LVERLHSRRGFFRLAGKLLPGVALAALPLPGLARTLDARRLSFYHTHTGETLDVMYAENGCYLSDALAEVNVFLRDFRTGDIHSIDPELLDILHSARLYTGSNGQIEVLSGFRSHATNERLRRASTGVAQHSLHMTGQAIDIRFADVSTRTLMRAAVSMGRGGVGYYPESDFVHLDTGRVRTW